MAGGQVKCQTPGMEHKAGIAALDNLITVEGIADDGAADTVEVDADLMSAASVGADLNESERLEPLQDAKLRNAGLAALDIDSHPPGTKLPQWLIDLALVVADNAVNKGQVYLRDRPGFKLAVELPVGLGIAGKDDHAAGFSVDAMNDIELLLPLGAEHLKERLVQPPAFRDRHQPLRLVDRQDVIIFIQNVNHKQTRTASAKSAGQGPFHRETIILLYNRDRSVKEKYNKTQLHMSVNRFFIPASSIESDRVRLGPEQSHQVCHVLRLRPGNTIVVLDDGGTEYDVTLTTIDRKETIGHVTGRHRARGEPTAEVTLFQSLLAREKFEWVLQKGTELGVAQFVPVLTERSLVRTKAIEENKLERWRRILTEAAEQSHCGRIPQLEPILSFDDAVLRTRDYDRRIIAAPGDGAVTLRDALRGITRSPASVAVMIGPEGGFTDNEVALACEKGAVRVGLGPRILRTETAAMVACALILYELGEMGA
jgi:16S rRNA (uracil1498-N3)-methyltransferase